MDQESLDQLAQIACLIDHSLLQPGLGDKAMLDGCKLARRLEVASVCIKPYAVPLAYRELSGSSVAVGTVVGFPHGNSHVSIKLKEAQAALADGATELDVVVNIGKVLDQDWEYVSEEIRAINELTVGAGGLLKVIFENDFLGEDAAKVRLCQICTEHKVAFVKTSTGYGFVQQPNGMYAYQGATEHDVALMRRESGPEVRVKAAGGVRTLDGVLRMRALGASRVGASATEAILAEAKRRLSAGEDLRV